MSRSLISTLLMTVVLAESSNVLLMALEVTSTSEGETAGDKVCCAKIKIKLLEGLLYEAVRPVCVCDKGSDVSENISWIVLELVHNSSWWTSSGSPATDWPGEQCYGLAQHKYTFHAVDIFEEKNFFFTKSVLLRVLLYDCKT